jgi:hypothetical protein
MMLLVGCAVQAPPSDAAHVTLILLPDANVFCSDEGAYTCTGGDGMACCGGRRVGFSDGPCWPGQPVECARQSRDFGCPCATEGAAECLRYRFATCNGGVWVASAGSCGVCVGL